MNIHLICCPEGGREVWHGFISTFKTQLPAFVHPHPVHQRYSTEVLFVCVKMGSQVELNADAGLAL